MLQQQTRTLLTEVVVDNASGRLAGGLYGIVHLDEPRQEPVFILPSQAVIFNQNGLSAAVYRDGTLQLRHLDLAADDGAQVEIRSGLQAGDRIILDPPMRANAVDGMRVSHRIAASKLHGDAFGAELYRRRHTFRHPGVC